MVVAGVVDALVMEVAEREGVGEIGAAAVSPGLSVVEFAPGVGTLAAVGGTGLERDSEGDPLRFAEQPPAVPEVEGPGVAAQHSGDQPGPTRQPPGLAGGDDLAAVQAGGLEPAAEVVTLVEGDHDGRGRAGVQVVGGEVFDDLAEPQAPGVVSVRPKSLARPGPRTLRAGLAGEQ